MAVYHGRQSKGDDCHTNRGVSMYPNEFLVLGGDMRTVPDSANVRGKKEYLIKDHLGSVRSIISLDSVLHIQSFDFKPFGDSLGAEQKRIGFTGNEKDMENSYFAMGARQYDARLGRFLSVDL